MKYPSVTSNSQPDQFVWISKEVTVDMAATSLQTLPKAAFLPFQAMRQWLDSIKLNNPRTAKFLCQLIPSRCPFERTVQLGGVTLLRIPPLCKLNPFYEQVVGLRFRALSYLADECGEDVTPYC